jgi:hypothetical protein
VFQDFFDKMPESVVTHSAGDEFRPSTVLQNREANIVRNDVVLIERQFRSTKAKKFKTYHGKEDRRSRLQQEEVSLKMSLSHRINRKPK